MDANPTYHSQSRNPPEAGLIVALWLLDTMMSIQMPCWPEVWEYVKNVSPLFGGLFAYSALVVVLVWAPKVRNTRLRAACRVLGGVGVVALIPLLFPIALSMGPPTERRTFRSSDGKEARLSYDAGFLGRDYTEVSLKHPGSCRHTKVFWHLGPSSFDDPKVEWIDAQHLRITYHTRSDDPQECEKQVGQVYILCGSEPWPTPARPR